MPIERVCEYCNKKFNCSPSRVKHGRGKHCSRECQYKAIRSRPNSKIKRVCLNCSKEFYKNKSTLEQTAGGGKYCSRECRDIHWRGESHPQFRHGNGVNWHGPNWYSQRRRALKRDQSTCKKCGITIDQLVEPLHVHHITPFRCFDNYQQANHLSNLVTLCPACHRIADAKFQSSE